MTTNKEVILNSEFKEISDIIAAAKQRAFQAVNTTLIELYWQVGEYISRKLAAAEWGDGIVEQLARHLAKTQPGLRGFTRPNLFRMRQFYESYRHDEKISPLVRQLSWTHHLIILSQSKSSEEREFYIRLAIREKWSKRELERQTQGAHFERQVLSPLKVSPVVRQLHAEVVEYALSHTLSPALISEYQMQLPDKKLLQAKLHEFYLQNTWENNDDRT